MLKLAYQLGFELALQEELNKIAGVPGEAFKIAPEAIAKAMRPAAKAAPAAKPLWWEDLKGLFFPKAETAATADVTRSPVYRKYRSGIVQKQRGG